MQLSSIHNAIQNTYQEPKVLSSKVQAIVID